MKDPVLEFRLVTEAGFPGGLVCPTCGRDVNVGQPFITHPLTPKTEVVTCVYCDAPREEHHARRRQA